jgi:hypothetical protein
MTAAGAFTEGEEVRDPCVCTDRGSLFVCANLRVIFRFIGIIGSLHLARDEFKSIRHPDRSAKRGVEGPLHASGTIKKRSLHYASLRSAPVGMTDGLELIAL